MHKLFNAFLVITVLVSGFMLYSLEHATRGTERAIARLETRIAGEREDIKLLSAEWSSLIRPDRLQRLAEEHLKLQTIAPSQIVQPAELAAKVPAEPPVKREAAGSDPIGDILEKMR
jgi:cell division protein FtsL